MVETASTMLPLGTKAPDFSLPDTDGGTVTLGQFEGKKGLVVLFICNHCPFVKLIREELAKVAHEYQEKGIGFVAIMSNDVENYPADSPEKMAEEKKNFGYPFPYLYDATQEVAKAYHAACTPDIFVFDGDLKLAYRGQFDDSRPGNGKPTNGADLRNVLDGILAGEDVTKMEQKPSIGCNIKWKRGNEPAYFNR